MYTYIYICMCMYIYIYTYVHTYSYSCQKIKLVLDFVYMPILEVGVAYTDENKSIIAIDMDLDEMSLGCALRYKILSPICMTLIGKLEYYSWVTLIVKLQPQT